MSAHPLKIKAVKHQSTGESRGQGVGELWLGTGEDIDANVQRNCSSTTSNNGMVGKYMILCACLLFTQKWLVEFGRRVEEKELGLSSCKWKYVDYTKSS